jgi:hypothetical protein
LTGVVHGPFGEARHAEHTSWPPCVPARFELEGDLEAIPTDVRREVVDALFSCSTAVAGAKLPSASQRLR